MYPLNFGIAAAVLAVVGFAAYQIQRSQQDIPKAEKPVETAGTFASLKEKINLNAPDPTSINLGTLPLGAIRELQIEIAGLNGGTLKTVQSSCSCLQIGAVPATSPATGLSLDARYLAVGAGLVDVTVALERVDASGKSDIATFRLIGEVMHGDPARSAKWAELVKTPPFPRSPVDPALLVSAKQAYLSVNSKRGLLIDVRSVEEFAREHAVGSLNIPLTELRPSKAFRDREVFLIGPALVSDPMQKACARLKLQGADRVSIVDGGVLAWQVAGGKVFQELDPQPVIGSLTVNDVAQRVAPLDVTYCGLGLGDEFDFRYLFPGRVRFAAGSNPVDMIEQQLAAEPSTRLVLIDPSGKNYGSLNQNAPAHWLGRVYYLRSGFPEYLQEVTRLSELAAASAVQQSSSVTGFARRNNLQRTTLTSSSGCGACPK